MRGFMALSEKSLRHSADLSRFVPLPVPDRASKRPQYDASPEAYRQLRQAVIEAGLLKRRYGYYLGRTLLCFGFLVAALALVPTVPEGWGWSALVATVLGFAFAQIAMIVEAVMLGYSLSKKSDRR